MKHLKTFEIATNVDAENQFNNDITNLITSYKTKLSLSNEQITKVLNQISKSVYYVLQEYDTNNPTVAEPTTQVKMAQPTSTKAKEFATQVQPTYKK